MTTRILVLFNEDDGTTEIQVEGVDGPSCTQDVKFVEEATGGEAIEVRETPEYQRASVRSPQGQRRLR